MQRFYHRQVHTGKRQIAAVLLFLTLLFAFSGGISSVSDKNHEAQTETLQKAISRGITHCYATEGHYPESLEYLQKKYGITYDKEQYFIDYQVLGKNIYPDVTIIEK